MKVFISFILLTCMFSTLSGYHFLMRLQVRQAKREMKRNLRMRRNHPDAITLQFSKEETNQLTWENEHEFHFQQNMYDIIEMETSDDSIKIRCVRDDKERLLVQWHMKILGKQKNGNQLMRSILSFLTNPFLLQPFHLPDTPLRLLSHKFPPYYATLPVTENPVDAPPPKVLLIQS